MVTMRVVVGARTLPGGMAMSCGVCNYQINGECVHFYYDKAQELEIMLGDEVSNRKELEKELSEYKRIYRTPD